MKWSGLICCPTFAIHVSLEGLAFMVVESKEATSCPLRALQNEVGEMVMNQILSCPCELKSGALWHRVKSE